MRFRPLNEEAETFNLISRCSTSFSGTKDQSTESASEEDRRQEGRIVEDQACPQEQDTSRKEGCSQKGRSWKAVASKAAPGKAAAGKSVSGKSAAGKSAPGKSAAGKSVSGKSASGKSAPGKAAAGKAASRKASPKRAPRKAADRPWAEAKPKAYLYRTAAPKVLPAVPAEPPPQIPAELLAASPKAAKPRKPRGRKAGAQSPAGALDTILAQLDDAKAEQVVTIALDDKSAIADTMVVASGRSTRHVGAIADQLVEKLKEAGCRDLGSKACRNATGCWSMRATSSSTSSGPRSELLQSREALVGPCAERTRMAMLSLAPRVIAVGPAETRPRKLIAEDYLTRAEGLGRKCRHQPDRGDRIRRIAGLVAAARMAEEARLIAGALPPKAFSVVLDERGKAMASEAFADLLRATSMAARRTVLHHRRA